MSRSPLEFFFIRAS